MFLYIDILKLYINTYKIFEYFYSDIFTQIFY